MNEGSWAIFCINSHPLKEHLKTLKFKRISFPGIYYVLPVVQFVYYYQETSLKSGNMDVCYFNYLCQYPVGPIEDYGHVLSNIGYIISGVSFMAIVRYR